ncbi:TrkH family potassium uptake protein [Ornithinibacillus sp. BX22]|uniref:TrkH family potassium uptake protein n=2 Tax=Ornithinibacillus TaxID=484508 RepID=A0A923RG27_9BACI|nr:MULTISPECIES: TrkH family potassium uptake protein [Ornithinibacillus]MBC5635794.1 TrkH family potassium uptake protein [Ornithinibacillus hominis]MBS3680217.1 TrkH family potassium uptake protein [Ornithinibacillus massiliensis]
MFLPKSFSRWINTLSPVRIILFFYIIAAIFSTILMSLPIAYKDGVEVDFIDVVFTAVSALSVTGLSTITVADTLSTTGIFLLAFILQLGAVGVMAIGTFIWLLLGKKIGLKERQLIMTDQNQTNFEGMVRLIKQIILVLLTVEFIAFLVLGTYFLKYFSSPGEAYLHGFFGTISAVTNGGFDITGESLIPFQHDYFVQFLNILLIIFGAIGFPVLIEVKNFLFSRNRMLTHFSLFTKLTTLTFAILIFVGTIGIFLLDVQHYFVGKSWHESLFYSLFQSVTTRSGGLSTMDVSELSESNHLFMSFLMFIGASPSSAGGGIRTTTFALAVIFIITYARGGSSIRIFRREIHEEDLMKAVTVTLMAIFMVFISVLFITTYEPFTITQILFEVTSAFGTVGLSMGITSELSTTTKIILMTLMFIGRVGILTFLFMFKKTKRSGDYHYPKERISIG